MEYEFKGVPRKWTKGMKVILIRKIEAPLRAQQAQAAGQKPFLSSREGSQTPYSLGDETLFLMSLKLEWAPETDGSWELICSSDLVISHQVFI